MTGTTWIGMLCILLLGTGLSYTAMKKMGAPLSEYKKPEPTVFAAQPQNKKPEAPQVKAEVEKPLPRNEWDSLWKKSLFQDDRTEDEAMAADNTPQQEVQSTEFELVGLARLGRKDSQVPVAIIVQAVGNPRNRFMRRPGMPGMPGMPNMPGGPGMPGGPNMPGGMAMRGGRMPPQLNRFQPMEPPPDEKKSSDKADKSLYREGDMIGSTGYKVKSIIMEENKVVLLQNGKETVLLLDEKNTNNSIRRETVKREELAVREKYKQQEEKDKNANQQANQNPNWQRPGFPTRFGPGGMRPGGMFPGGVPQGMQPPNFNGFPGRPGGFTGAPGVPGGGPTGAPGGNFGGGTGGGRGFNGTGGRSHGR